MSNIDPTAIVSPDVEIGADVTIGPFAIVEEGVVKFTGPRTGPSVEGEPSRIPLVDE